MEPITLPRGYDLKKFKAKITDFAIFESNIKNGINNPCFYREFGRFFGNYYYLSGDVLLHTAGGSQGKIIASDNQYGVRPAISGEWFDLVKDEFKKICRVPFDKDGRYYATFGEYIGNVITKFNAYQRDSFFTKHQDKIVFTGKKYSQFSCNQQLREFMLGIQKFVVYSTRDVTCKSQFGLSENQEYVLLEIKPLRFIVDEKRRVAISNEVVLIGPPIGDLCNDFEETELCRYLNTVFLKEILLPDSKLHSYFDRTIENQEHKDTQDLSEENSVDSLIRKIHDAIRLYQERDLIDRHIESLLDKYKRQFDELQDNMSFRNLRNATLTLEPVKTPADLKKDLLFDLENILREIKKHNEELAAYYEMIISINNKKNIAGSPLADQSELDKDIDVIKKAIDFLCEDSKNSLWLSFASVLYDVRSRISMILVNSFVISDETFIYKRPEEIKSYEDWELEIRKNWHSLLEKLTRRVASKEVEKEIMSVIQKSIDGIRETAHESVASMYLNVINETSMRIRKLIDEVPPQDKEDCTRELLSILKMTLEEEKTVQNMLNFLRNKWSLLNGLEIELQQYVDNLDDLKKLKLN